MIINPLTADDLPQAAKAMMDWASRLNKANPLQKAKDEAERTLAEIAEAGAEPDDFEPHVGMGWYSTEIVNRFRYLLNTDSDATDQVAILHFEIGALITEARLLSAWGDDVEKAVTNNATREDVNKQNTLASHSERKEIVSAILAERNRGVTDACKIAAFRFPEKGKFTTFRTSYYEKS